MANFVLYTVLLRSLKLEKISSYDRETCTHVLSGHATDSNAAHIHALDKLRPSLSCPAFSVYDLPVQTIDDKRTDTAWSG